MPISKRTKRTKSQRRTKRTKRTKTQKTRGGGYTEVYGYEPILTHVSEILYNQQNIITKVTLRYNGINYIIVKNENFNPQYGHKEINIDTVRQILNSIGGGNSMNAQIEYIKNNSSNA
jgi:hypothetical protein